MWNFMNHPEPPQIIPNKAPGHPNPRMSEIDKLSMHRQSVVVALVLHRSWFFYSSLHHLRWDFDALRARSEPF